MTTLYELIARTLILGTTTIVVGVYLLGALLVARLVLSYVR